MNQKICSFILTKRNKQCKFIVYKDGDFCIHHTQNDEIIPCPIDSTHTIFKKKLEKHIKICTKLRQQNQLKSQNYYQENINKQAIKTLETNTQTKISQYQVYKCKEFMTFLLSLEEKFIISVNQLIEYYQKNQLCTLQLKEMKQITFDYDQNELSATEKNNQQGNQLISIMRSQNLIQNFVYIEFGAGKGYFSHRIAEETQEQFIIKDNLVIYYWKWNLEGINMIKIIDQMQTLKDQLWIFHIFKLILYLKFLIQKTIKQQEYRNTCNYLIQGVDVIQFSILIQIDATDLQIQTLLQCKEPLQFKGMVLATCCHHKCQLDQFHNLDFLQKLQCNINQINDLFFVSSWAVETKKQIKRDTEELVPTDEVDRFYYDLDVKKKGRFGIMAKRIIDIARCFYLIDNNCLVQYYKYCDYEITPENFVIIVNNI